MLKIYPSSLSFSIDGQNTSSSSSTCYRYKQLSQGSEFELHPIYNLIGEKHEEAIESHLKSNNKDYKREEPFKVNVAKNVELSGRADFVLDDMILEAKATLSTSMKSRLNKGEFKYEHLAQLICYMLFFKKLKGQLVYGYYQYNNVYELVRTKTFIFKVEIDDGQIIVDGIPTGYDVINVIDNVKTTTKYLLSDVLAPPPDDIDFNSFTSPCKYCVLQKLCKPTFESVEDVKLTKGLKNQALALISSQPIKQDIKIPKVRDKKFHKDLPKTKKKKRTKKNAKTTNS